MVCLDGVHVDTVYVVSLDNDNIATDEFPRDCRRAATEQLPVAAEAHAENWVGFVGAGATVCAHWLSRSPGTFGRIGLPRSVFRMVGGYDEEFEAMGWQDVDLLHRLALLGTVEEISNVWVGFSLPNDPENTNELMVGPTQRRSRPAAETSIKAAHTSGELDFTAMNNKNRQISRTRRG